MKVKEKSLPRFVEEYMGKEVKGLILIGDVFHKDHPIYVKKGKITEQVIVEHMVSGCLEGDVVDYLIFETEEYDDICDKLVFVGGYTKIERNE